MRIARRFGFWLSATLLSLTTGLLLVSLTLSSNVLDRHVVKNWLIRSDTYGLSSKKLIAPEVRHSYETKSSTPNGALSGDIIEKAAVASFSREFVDKSSETAIDAMYDWLDQKTDSVKFSIPLDGPRDTFAKTIHTEVLAKFHRLPRCLDRSTSINAIEAGECLPISYPVDVASKEVVDNFMQHQMIFAQPLTPENSISGIDALRSSHLPQYVDLLKTLTLTAWVIVPFALLGAVLLSSGRWRGLISAGLRIGIPGIITVLLGIVASILIPKIHTATQSNNSATMEVIQPLLKTIGGDVGFAAIKFGGIAVGIGIVLVIVGYIGGRKMRQPGSQF